MTEERAWTIEDVEEQPGYSVDKLAAYQCGECGTVVPVNFAREQEEPPEGLPNYGCGEIWGGCGEYGPMRLVETVQWRDR